MSEDPQGIAIVGIAGRFPGARNVAEFWQNLVAGRETIEQLSDDQLKAAGLDPAALRAQANYIAARGVLERPEWFDAGFFGLTPKEAEVIDPQQRVFLEEAWTALEDAGIDPARSPGPIGVFAGMSNNTYWMNNVSTRPDLVESVGWLNAMMGNEKDYLATRVAYKFDLHGPAISLYTACSTSLVAVCQACTSLLNFQCDAALAGGVSITFPQERGYEFHEGGITSPDGHCRAFDVQAAGTVFSHGVGVVVLKRLSDALAAGDQIYAVVKGHALNNDGASKVSFTAPSVDGHAEVITLAQGFAGFSPESISYVETHGTATPLGDPIEIAGLTQAFRAETERRGFCAIGSVKTNIGHLDAAAGVTGLIKTALALKHRTLPASLHFTEPNPQLELETSPFFVNTALREWPAENGPRRAGVSSFGVGGTNAHVVLEESPGEADAPIWTETPQLIVLSARSLRALEDATAQLARHLRKHPGLPLDDVAFTLQQGRHAFAFRRFVVARNATEAGRWLMRRDRRHVFTTPARGTASVPPNESDPLAMLGQRWIAGQDIDFAPLHRSATPKIVSLPTYPFQRERYWAEPHRAAINPAPAVPEPTLAQPQDIFAALKAELAQLSGVDLHSATPETALVDLGFDSLFLTQIAISLQKKFGVRLRFRQFLDELATLGALAAYLREHQQAPQAAPATSPAPVIAAAPARPAAHGPFRRIDTSAPSELTAAQQRHLDDLIARYTQRTAGSKRFTAENRARFADPRAVSGFRRVWKEMVYPLVADRSEGAKLWDIDGHEYTDITLGFGQILLGHRPPFFVEAIERQLHRGIEIGPTSPLAGEVATLVSELTGMERVGFCNTGSEAVMAAIRTSRTVSGRDKIAVFAGAYHGIFDEVLIRPGSTCGAAAAIAPGIPEAAISNVFVLDYGEVSALDFIRQHAHEIAAVLVEPVQSRRPDLQPREFLHELRRVTAEREIALVFDEVVTGFRCHPGGAQAHFGIRADLATYGKVVGGGMPIGIVAGSPRYMDALDGGMWNFGDDSVPEVGVTFFAGTFVRHPLALAAAKSILTHLKAAGPALQRELDAKAERFVGQLNDVLAEYEAPLRWTRFSSMFHLPPPAELKFAGTLWAHLRLRGVHAWEGRPNFISTAHTEQDFAQVLGAFRESVAEVVRAGFIPRSTAVHRSTDPNVFPLTEAQQEIRLAAQLGGDASAAYNESVTIRFRGALDLAALETALNTLTERHEALRTTIGTDTQRVHPPTALHLAPVSGDPAAAIQAETANPFDLEHGPVFRAVLLKLSETEHLLVLTVHHIVCDGWSFGTLATELAALYSQRPLPPSHPFREYVSWLATQPLVETERYWLQRFATNPPALDLPTDRPRPAQRTYRAERRITTLSSELIGTLQRVSSTHRCTLFTTMLGAFHVLLHRLGGQDEIVVGIAAAGQPAMGNDSVVGHCLNFLPIRASLDGEKTFAAFLGTLKGDVLDAFEHQHFTLGALLQKLSLPRDPSRTPLTAVTFNIDRAATGLDFAGVEAVFDINAKSRLGFELSFNLLETDHGWQLYCAFNADLFDGTTIDRWLAHYRTLLEAVATDAATPISRLPLLDEPSKHQLLEWSTGLRQPYPHDRPIHELFAEVAARQPDAIAYEGEQTLTYGELDHRANRVANHLIAQGLRPGGIVVLRGERSSQFLWEAIGTLRAGGAYLPLSAEEPAARRQIIESKADLSLNGPATYENASDAPVKLTVDPAGPAYLIFTSGSTGTPKGVLIPHRAIARLVCHTDYAQLREDDVVSHQSNLSFDAATFEIWGTLLNGGKLILTTTAQLLDSSVLAAHYSAKSVTTAFVTTALFNRLVRERPGIFRSFRHVLFGGERCDPAAVEMALTAKPAHLLHVYGPTEATTFALSHPVERVENRTVPIGRPIANTDVFILDPTLQLVPIGVTGEIYIGGPGLAIGYDDPALTAQRFIETPLGRLYQTGDRARWLAEGTIDILGRADRQVKLRGFRIEPGEIEAALRAIPGVGECVVTLRDEMLVAYLTANSTEPPPAAELREQLSRSLPPWMLPGAFVRLPQMPLTPNGKIDLHRLPAPQDDAAPRRDGRPETTLHIELIALWQRTLGRQAIGIHDDFFSLGGHSLLAAQMLSAVEQQFGMRVPFSVMFEKATIAHLAAALVDARRRTSGESPLVPVQTSGTKTPIFFFHGDFSGGGFFCRNLARHLGADRPFYALHPHGLHGEAPPASIEAMAADRLNEVRRQQPRGPYLLGGFCNGALVAFEIARQLTAAGEKVEAVIMIGADGVNFRYRHVDRFARSLSQFAGDDEPSRAQRFLAWREKAQGVEKWGRSQMMRLRAATGDLGHVPRRIAQILRPKPAESAALPAPTLAPAHESAASPTVVDAYNRAIDAYIPAPYAGPIILVWSNDDPVPAGGIAYGWESVCRDVQVIVAPGDHQSTVALDENLRELAVRLLPALKRIESRP